MFRDIGKGRVIIVCVADALGVGFRMEEAQERKNNKEERRTLILSRVLPFQLGL